MEDKRLIQESRQELTKNKKSSIGAVLLKALKVFPFVFPFIFVLLFFGYIPPSFDLILYTDNIEGEGLGSTYLCPAQEFAYSYQVDFYFGSQLKQTTIEGYHYDVEEISFEVSDVTQADFLSFDVLVFGIPIRHFDMKEMITPGNYDIANITIPEDGEGVRMEFSDPNSSTPFTISGDFLPLTFWIIYWAFILIVTLVASFGVSVLWEHFSGFKIQFACAAGVLVAMLLGCLFCGSFPYLDYLDFLLNYIIVLSVSLILGAVTLPFIGAAATMAFVLFWYIVNYFVIFYRNKPMMPADLKAISTVNEVISGYTLTIPFLMVVCIAVTILYEIMVFMIWKKYHKKEGLQRTAIIKRILTATVAVFLLYCSIHNSEFASLNEFQWDNMLLKSFHSDGMVLTYLKSEFSSKVQEPDGYSREKVRAYLEEYKNENVEKPKGTQPVNIIMVMDEALADLRTIGLDSQIDVMPYMDSLKDNTIEGQLFVSVFGGGTCNTEFEALTGNSMAFLSTGAYPYTENITSAMFSLASYFKSVDYITEAFHANSAKNWNRNIVYPNLGFEAFHSIDNYPESTEETTLHGHPADISDYLYMEQVGEQYAGKRRFLFNVTMQNHSPYDRWEDVPKAESVAQYGSELYFDTQVYLSLVKASDDAVKQLVETYKDSDEATMIIYFGDHQPGLPSAALQELSSTMNPLDYFNSKFFIWTNYEIMTEHDYSISANYLPWLILERGNFELPPYVRMLKEVHEKYPIISAMGVVDSDGKIYGSINDLLDDPLIQKYQYIQYANLFDEIDDGWFTVE